MTRRLTESLLASCRARIGWYAYLLRTWRCRLFGHAWGPEQSDTYGTGITAESWRRCQRPGCDGWWETYHYLGGSDRVYG